MSERDLLIALLNGVALLHEQVTGKKVAIRITDENGHETLFRATEGAIAYIEEAPEGSVDRAPSLAGKH